MLYLQPVGRYCRCTVDPHVLWTLRLWDASPTRQFIYFSDTSAILTAAVSIVITLF